MKILNLISRLIDYPTEDLYQAGNELVEVINNDELLSNEDKVGLLSFIQGRCLVNGQAKMDILDWQSDYDALFERGRSVSLLLFEHIHGESRDRGQAMIDLIAHYKEAGLDIGIRELPDYIPLFLEFVATQGEEAGTGWMQDVSHIFALLYVRLAQRNSDYAPLFKSLVNISKAEINFEDLATQVKGEKRDDTKEAIDKVWEEEMVKFGPDSESSVCGTAINKPSETQRRDQEVPINFMETVIDETLAKDATAQLSVGGK